MPSAHVNREWVEGQIERLQGEYSEVHVEEMSRELPPEAFEDERAVVRDGYTGGGYAWVVRGPDQSPALSESIPEDIDSRRRVLTILGRRGRHWGVPGGGREDDETSEEAAVREVREETNVDCEIADLFLLRRVGTDSGGDHDNGSTRSLRSSTPNTSAGTSPSSRANSTAPPGSRTRPRDSIRPASSVLPTSGTSTRPTPLSRATSSDDLRVGGRVLPGGGR